MQKTTSPIALLCALDNQQLSLENTADPACFQICDTTNERCLGEIRRDADSPVDVEAFYGKGGFMVTLSSPGGLRYFALPGSRIEVLGTQLTLHGESITANPNTQASQKHERAEAQNLTRQATILGAGLATRFERISGESTDCSKPGVPLLGDKTVIECIADTLVRHGVSHLIVNTFFKPKSIKRSLDRSKAERVSYIDEAAPSGTAGGLRKMLLDSAYAGVLDESQPLLVVQGDAVTDADFSTLIEAHHRSGALVTIGCQLVPEADVSQFGIMVTDRSGPDGQSGVILEFQEEPAPEQAKSRLGSTGFYVLSPKAYPLLRTLYAERLAQAQAEAKAQGVEPPAELALDFGNDVFPALLKKAAEQPDLGCFWGQAIEGYWSDIGNPRQYIECIHDLYAQKVQLPLPEQSDLYYHDGVIFWEGARAIAQEEQAVLQGNVVVARPYCD